MEKQLSCLNLVLDGKQIHRARLLRELLDEVNAGLLYHLQQNDWYSIKRPFELIDTNNNHSLPDLASLMKVSPVTPDITGGISIHHQRQQRLYRLLIIPVQITILRPPIIYKSRLLTVGFRDN